MKTLTPDKTIFSESNTADELIVQSLAKLDSTALGVSVGALAAFAIFLATNFLIYKGGEIVGPNLALLSQYFVGYEITYRGSLIGAIYGLIFGFITGWLIAFLRNSVIGIYLYTLKIRGSVAAVNDFIDNP